MKKLYALLGLLLLVALLMAQNTVLRDFSCQDAGANDTYACSLPAAPSGYATSQRYLFKANTANTGAATVNFNSLGAITIKKVAGGVTTDLADNDIRAGQWVGLIYDGTNMQMQSALGNIFLTTAVTSVATTAPITGGTITTTGTIACATCVTASSPGVGIAHFAGSTQAVTSSLIVAADITSATITGTQLAASLALTTPNIGAATGTSLLVTGIVDGTSPVTVTTGTTATLGAATYKSGYTFNQEATAATGVTYTLPATAVGLQYCVKNSIVSGTGAADTGVLTVYPAASSFVILNGTRNTVGGGGTHGVASGGAAGDAACFVAVDATDWEVYVQKGTWTAN